MAREFLSQKVAAKVLKVSSYGAAPKVMKIDVARALVPAAPTLMSAPPHPLRLQPSGRRVKVPSSGSAWVPDRVKMFSADRLSKCV